MAMPKTVVYILSTNYAGSHFLSLLLGSNSCARHIGEIKGLRRPAAERRKEFCALCGSTKLCPLLKDITPARIADAYEIIFANAGPPVTTLIDNSKKIFWAARYLNDGRYNKKYIHLIRDPRALVRRWLLQNPPDPWGRRWKIARACPAQSPAILLGPRWYFHLYKWLVQNRAITEFIASHRLDARIATYRDVALDTASTLRPLTEWAGLAYEPAQLSFWNFEHHGTQKKDYQWIKERKTSHFDARWQSSLPFQIQQAIVKNTAVRKYIQKIGLQMKDEGLTQQGLSNDLG